MNILIASSGFSKPYLGPSVVAHNILKGFIKIDNELTRKNIKITFLSLNEKNTYNISENLSVIGRLTYPSVTFTGEIQAFIRKLMLNERYDIIHSHNIYEISPYLFSKTRLLFTLHGLFWREREFKKQLYSKIYLKLGEIRFSFYYPYLSRFIAISPYVLEEIKARGFDTSKAVIIGNPVSDEFFDVKKIEENMILYPSTLIPLKNQIGFLKSLSLIKKDIQNYKIIFAGQGDSTYINNLKKYVKRENLNVEFLGKVPYEKMPELYSKASIVALTSFEETFGMSILEAMASGTPVMTSGAGGIKYLVKDAETGFIVDPNNPEEIADKLLIMIHDETLRKKMGTKAKEEAEKFRCENISKDHLELYLATMSDV